MQHAPLTDKGTCSSRQESANHLASPNVDHGLVAAVKRVKVRRRMILPIKRDGDAEESADNRHSHIPWWQRTSDFSHSIVGGGGRQPFLMWIVTPSGHEPWGEEAAPFLDEWLGHTGT